MSKDLMRRIGQIASWPGGMLLSLALLTSVRADEPQPQGPESSQVDFQKDVAPILAQHCVDCHGPDLQMADLRLDQRKLALAEGDARGLIRPGKSAESLLIQRLVDKRLGIVMPPSFPFFPGEKAGLAEAKITVLKAWIDQGAPWPDDSVLASPTESKPGDPQVPVLIAAIRAGEHQTVQRLLDKTLVNARDHEGVTPLAHAATLADAKMVQLLVEAGADVNLASGSGATPLMQAAGDPEKVRLLLASGAEVNAKSEMGRTPLLIAATFAGNVESVRLLLQAGGKVTDQDMFGETCLTSAAKRGDAQMVEELIAAGADVAAGGRPPLVWAAEEGNVATLRSLLGHGAGKKKPHLNFALSSAAARGPDEAVRLLLAEGANPNIASPIAGYTPLMWAAYSENVSGGAIELLLAKGAKLDAKGATGETPLSLAQKRGATQIVKLLQPASDNAGEAPVNATPTDAPAAPPPSTEQLKAAAEKSLALLQKCGPTFFVRSGCVACHQQSITSLALAEARKHGLPYDHETAREQLKITALTSRSYRDRFLQRVDHPAGSAPSVGYLLLGMGAEHYPADETTDAMIVELAGRQQLDGSWTAFGHRPPLEYSRISATALALRALQQYGPPGLKEPLAARIERAREWLLSAEPASNSEHAFRLLGLAWAGAEQEQLAAEAKHLLESQRADGGWAQFDSLESDAFATGLTLYAVHTGGGTPTTHDAYERGVAFLLRTQLDDGSWHVKTRSFPFQPYFESGFPHGHDQWISATATGLAAIALMQALPPADKAAE